MSEIKEVLVTAQLSESNRQRLEEALAPAVIHYAHFEDRAAIEAVIDRVDAAILQYDAEPYVIAGKKLKWIHCCHAGLDESCRPELFQRGIILTGSAGRSASGLAEHVVMLMLSLTHAVPMLVQAKQEHYWCGREYGSRKAMTGKTVGIIGMGNTGRALVQLLQPFGMEILAWRRKPQPQEGVNRIYSADAGDSLLQMLGQCDYVVLCCSLNDETWQMMNAKAFAAMKPTAYLINIGRGGLVDEPAMVEALKNGTIAGAGLDNFSVEPLPADSPLWDLPNVVITPHATPSIAGGSENKSVSFAIQNLNAFRGQGDFVNRLTDRDVFTHR